MFATHARLLAVAAAALTLLQPRAASAQLAPPQLRDTFPIGDAKGALCQVQTTLRDPVATGMFDRGWIILCRDAGGPVGTLRMIKAPRAEAEARVAAARPGDVRCTGFAACTVGAAAAPWLVETAASGDALFLVEGYGAYADALRLALRSVAENRIATGTISVAQTSAGTSDGFARDLAGSIDMDQALGEGYRRNHSGDYADAAEFFEALARRADAATGDLGVDPTEFQLNRALQKSNLGEFAEAAAIFAQVEAVPTADLVQLRLRRNYRAIHALNQKLLDEAVALLAAPLPPVPAAVEARGEAIRLTSVAAAGLNSGANARALRQGDDEERLTPQERAAIIDAQALHLQGTAERLRGNAAAARAAQLAGLRDAVSVRDGRVTSIIRLRSQMLGEIALADEALGNIDSADARFAESIALLASEYPETAALASARARHAAFMVRQGRGAAALTLYRALVADLAAQRRTLTGMTNQMAPYFRLLADRAAGDPAAIANFFLAGQLLVRPGVADTQAILARELSSGSSDGARLFRQATNLARDIERARVEDARLAQLPPAAEITALRAEQAAKLDALSRQQAETLAALAAFPQYRAIEPGSMTLAELQALLGEGEVYVRTMVVGDSVYGLLADGTAARLWTSPLSRTTLNQRVDAVRASIAVRENGRITTYPFDASAAHQLFRELFAPVADALTAARHIIYEPDGAMLRLPLNLLVTAETGLAAYAARLADPETSDTDAFDVRGIAFLGRQTATSTVVSPLAFRNARRASPSRAARAYFGAGQNEPAAAELATARGGSAPDCHWPLSEWNKPIAPGELLRARAALGAEQSTIITQAAFTDTALQGLTSLNDYRVLHFATHGLVTPPRPGCPARPALLTSFGGDASDGLLSFEEIFDLRLDADLVILSACDTAGGATIAATREAGLTTGGGTALDGLVRAFIGAGGRSIIASHWPVPDDFAATERLIGGMFSAAPGTSIGEALLAAQRALMADARTSHPYYWSGFAIVGDARQPIIRASDSVAAR
jgi:CHAT domain-containing protein